MLEQWNLSDGGRQVSYPPVPKAKVTVAVVVWLAERAKQSAAESGPRLTYVLAST